MAFFENIGAKVIGISYPDILEPRALVDRYGKEAIYVLQGNNGKYQFTIEDKNEYDLYCQHCVFSNKGRCRIRCKSDFGEDACISACDHRDRVYFKAV